MRERLLPFGDLRGLGTGLVAGLMDDQPVGMPLGEFGIPGQHVVGEDPDSPLPQRLDLCPQEVEGKVRMHPPMLAREVGVTVHVLGEDSRAIHMRRQQAVTELVRVEALGELRHMPRSMVFDVDLSPGDGTPRGNTGIDPEFPGDPAGIRKRRRAGILEGFRLTGNARSSPCPYARSNGRLQEPAAIEMVRHWVHSCGPVMKFKWVSLVDG